MHEKHISLFRPLVVLSLSAALALSSVPTPALAELADELSLSEATTARSAVSAGVELKLVDAAGNDVSAAAPVESGAQLRLWAGTSELDEDFGDEIETELADYSIVSSYQWYRGVEKGSGYSPQSYAGYTAIDGASGQAYTATDDDDGLRLACKVTFADGVQRWSAFSSGPVKAMAAPEPGPEPSGTPEDEARLASAIDALKKDGFGGYRPSPKYADGQVNLNALIEARLKELGFEGVSSKVVSVSWGAPAEAGQQGGIDTGDGPDNGSVSFFSLDLAHRSGHGSVLTLRQFCASYQLSLGTATGQFTPGRNTTLDWDEASMRSQLEGLAAAVAPSFAAGDAADGLTQDFALPNKGEGVNVSWSSSDPAIKVSGNSWDATSQAQLTRGSEDVPVRLAAKVGFSGPEVPDLTVTREFAVTVKGDPEKVARETAQLQAALDAGYLYQNVSFATGDSHSDASSSFTLPNPRKLGVNGSQYKVTYSSDSTAFLVNAYRANVVQPLAGGRDQLARITCTVVSKKDPSIRAAKTLEFIARPLAESEIDAELALMEQAKEGYAAALLDGQDAGAVTGNLRTFQKAYLDAGELAWSRSVSDAGYKRQGIVPVELPGYDSMGPAGQARLFKSSDPAVVANENLLVTTPRYDSRVSVSSRLTSERFRSYYDRYKDDEGVSAGLKAKLAALVDQDVSAELTVRGSEGKSPNVSVRATVIGMDSFGASELWAAERGFELKRGSTAADLTTQLLEVAKIAHDSSVGQYGFTLNSVTSPTTGKTLSWDESTGRYWQLFVNGEASGVGASSLELEDGMSVVWCYSAFGAKLPDLSSQTVTANVRVVGPSASGSATDWLALTELSAPAGTTAAQLSKRALGQAGLVTDDGILTISAPEGQRLPNGEPSLGATQSGGQWSWWQLFINGRLSDVMAAEYVVKPGDQIVWSYGRMGDPLPQNSLELHPDAERPSYQSDWPGHKGPQGTGVTSASTPTVAAVDAQGAWPLSVARPWTKMSDPILVNGDAYVAVEDELRVYDGQTAALKATARLATTVGYTSNLQYVDGLVLVPLDTGRLQAVSAKVVEGADGAHALQTVWVTESLPEMGGVFQQANSKLFVRDGYVYFGTMSGVEGGGYLCSVSLRSGAVRWCRANEKANYYWCGMAAADGGLLVVDESGTLSLLDASTGETLASLALGAHVRSSVTEADGLFYVVSTDGVLHKLQVKDGRVVELGKLAFAAASTCTPTIKDGKAYVGGATAEFKGVMSVIDLSDMSVLSQVGKLADGSAIPAEIKSTPLLAQVDGRDWVYFTANAKPGSLYGLCVGEHGAVELYRPKGAEREEFNISFVASDAQGSLYYRNDSGTLFKLSASSVPHDYPPYGADPVQPEPEEPAEPAQPQPAGPEAATPGNAEQAADSGKTAPSAKTNARFSLRPGEGKDATSSPSAIAGPDGSGLLSGQGEGVAGAESALAGEALATGLEKSDARGEGLPVWPFVGMAGGALLLLLVLLRRRRAEEGPGDASTGQGR